MTEWTPEDFGPLRTGPQFEWLNGRLTMHGFPLNKYLSTLKERVRAFQLSKGWTGTGADGYIGPKTLSYLKALPVPPPIHGINTRNWKETLPIGEPGHPDEVFPINSFQADPWFVQRNGHLIFRSNAGGVKTANSVHARSELREMDGDAKAKWNTDDGRDHLLDGNLAITALPPHIPIVVFGQCHDVDDDVFMLAAVGEREDPSRFDVEIWRSLGKDQGNDKKILLRDWRLKDFLDYNMLFTEDGFLLVLNDKPVYDWPGTWEDCYWKAGCYPQTNVQKGEKASAYGEVDYAALVASHK